MLKRYIVTIGMILLVSLFACDDTDIVLPDSGGETVLFDIPDEWEHVLEIVPTFDKKLLFIEFLTDDGHYAVRYISTYDLETREVERLLGGHSGYCGASVSPNGERMLYSSGWYDLHLTTFPPSEDDVRIDIDGLDWGNWFDDSHIYYTIWESNSSNLNLLNVDTMVNRRLIETDDPGGFGAEISPDKESWVLIRDYDFNWEHVFHADLYSWDGENLTFVRSLFDNHDGYYKCGPWSPDGTKLIVIGNRTDDPEWDGTTDRAIFVYDVKEDDFTQLTFTDYKEEGGPQIACWSADGNTIYFSTTEHIYSVDARKVYH